MGDMTPGEINARVAEKVMGWHASEDGYLWLNERDEIQFARLSAVKAWNPHGDIAHAMEVDVAMTARGFYLTAQRSGTGWWAYYQRSGGKEHWSTAFTDLAPNICAAALAAVEEQET